MRPFRKCRETEISSTIDFRFKYMYINFLGISCTYLNHSNKFEPIFSRSCRFKAVFHFMFRRKFFGNYFGIEITVYKLLILSMSQDYLAYSPIFILLILLNLIYKFRVCSFGQVLVLKSGIFSGAECNFEE